MGDVITTAGAAASVAGSAGASGDFGILQAIAAIVIIFAVAYAVIIVSSRIRNNGKLDKILEFTEDEFKKVRQLHIYMIIEARRKLMEKRHPLDTSKDGPIRATTEQSVESMGFRIIPPEIDELLKVKRPVKVNQGKMSIEGITTLDIKEYLNCLDDLEDKVYILQIENWWTIIRTVVGCSLIVLFSITGALDNGFGAFSLSLLGFLVVFALAYFYKCANNGNVVNPGEKGSKLFRGIPVGDLGQGKPWLWWLLETVVKEPSVDHALRIDMENVPIPVTRAKKKKDGAKDEEDEEDHEYLPNVLVAITTAWRYGRLTKALRRIGGLEKANSTIEVYLKGQFNALVNVYFADVNGNLQKIMENCGYLGEELDRIIQDMIIGYWNIDIDPINVEPDTPEEITKARDNQAISEYEIRTAKNKAKATLAGLMVNIQYMEALKASTTLKIDEDMMKAIIAATVLKEQIMAVGSKINLFAADKGLLESVFSLFGKTTSIPKPEDVAKSIKGMDPEALQDMVKKVAEMYNAFMQLKTKVE